MSKDLRPVQPDLPQLAIGPETIEVGGPDLARVCAELKAQGRTVVLMNVIGLSGYQLLVTPPKAAQ